MKNGAQDLLGKDDRWRHHCVTERLLARMLGPRSGHKTLHQQRLGAS